MGARAPLGGAVFVSRHGTSLWLASHVEKVMCGNAFVGICRARRPHRSLGRWAWTPGGGSLHRATSTRAFRLDWPRDLRRCILRAGEPAAGGSTTKPRSLLRRTGSIALTVAHSHAMAQDSSETENDCPRDALRGPHGTRGAAEQRIAAATECHGVRVFRPHRRDSPC